jgi:hypothetical protein
LNWWCSLALRFAWIFLFFQVMRIEDNDARIGVALVLLLLRIELEVFLPWDKHRAETPR